MGTPNAYLEVFEQLAPGCKGFLAGVFVSPDVFFPAISKVEKFSGELYFSTQASVQGLELPPGALVIVDPCRLSKR